jgi:protein-S-isoprenylcysteine O-methyltransferase Ste14
MLTDEQLIERLSAALADEAATVEPPRHLLDAIEHDLRTDGEEPARRKPPRRRWLPSLGTVVTGLSVGLALAVLVVAVTTIRYSPHHAAVALHPASHPRTTATHHTTMKPYIETHQIGAVWLVIWLLTVFLNISFLGRRVVEDNVTERVRWVTPQLVISVAVGVVLLLLSPKYAPGATIHPALAAVWIGIGLWCLGEGLRLWSFQAHRQDFVFKVLIGLDQSAAASGPYRFLRHPNFLGILVMVLGGSLVWGNWVGLAALMVLVAAPLLHQIHTDERDTARGLGSRYGAYEAGRKRLLPFIW